MRDDELSYLLASIELFWPAFLGEIVIALDAGDNRTLSYFYPPVGIGIDAGPVQSYRLVYEDVPCAMPGSFFNQVRYSNLDLHVAAPYVVTILVGVAARSPGSIFACCGLVSATAPSSSGTTVRRCGVEVGSRRELTAGT